MLRKILGEVIYNGNAAVNFYEISQLFRQIWTNKHTGKRTNKTTKNTSYHNGDNVKILSEVIIIGSISF